MLPNLVTQNSLAPRWGTRTVRRESARRYWRAGQGHSVVRVRMDRLGASAVGGQPTGLSLKDLKLNANALEKSSYFTVRNPQTVAHLSHQGQSHLCESAGLWSQGHSTAQRASRTDQGWPQVGGDWGGRMAMGCRTWVDKLVRSEGSCSVTCQHWGLSAVAWRPCGDGKL